MSAVQHDEKKLSLAQFVWLGFNYTVGIAFVGNLAILSNFVVLDDKGKVTINSGSVGMHIIWIFLLLGIVASICAFAFAKLAKVHKSDNNGGAYLYIRTAFGRFAGFFSMFMQYITLPFLITAQIFNLLKAFFEGDYAGDTGMDLSKALGSNGHWASIILDLCGIVLYFLFAFVIFGGMKLFKKLSNATGIIKWVTSAFLVIGAIYLASQPNLSGHNATQNYKNWFDTSWVKETTGSNFKLGFDAFTKAFTSCFFFYAGFEVFATAGKNIENPDKNLGLGILIIMLITTVFYIAIIFLFIGAIDPTPLKDENGKYIPRGFIQNMNMGLWTYEAFKNGNIMWVSYCGMGIMIISQISLKANVSMQNALYGGTMLQPLATEGYISEKYNELNKDDLPVKGSKLNFIITGVVLVIWLIIPDLYEGIAATKPVFNVSQLTEASSAITLFIYAMVIASIGAHGFKRRLKVHPVEWTAFGLVFVLLCIMVVYHYYGLFDSLSGFGSSFGSDEFSAAVGAAVELVFIIVSAIFGIIWYFTYYKSVLKKRLSTPEGIEKQKQLDGEFVLINNEEFMSVLYGKKGSEKRNIRLNEFKSFIKMRSEIDAYLEKIRSQEVKFAQDHDMKSLENRKQYKELKNKNKNDYIKFKEEKKSSLKK